MLAYTHYTHYAHYAHYARYAHYAHYAHYAQDLGKMRARVGQLKGRINWVSVPP
jgi:hypothetical protein